MKKIFIKIILILITIFLISFFIFWFSKNEKDLGNKNKIAPSKEQQLLQETYEVSKNYISLRYKTNDILVNAEDYGNYKNWKNELDKISSDWEILEIASQNLQNLAKKESSKISINKFMLKAQAYDKKTISNIFDIAFAKEKIDSLAKYILADTKKVPQLLRQNQYEIKENAWTGFSDSFQKLEFSAGMINDSCKITGFVGGVEIGKISGESNINQLSIIINGGDLSLLINDDNASISLANNNKISGITIKANRLGKNIPNVLTLKNIKEKSTNSTIIVLGLEKFRKNIQEGKIIGVELKDKNPMNIFILDKNEIEKWLNSIGIKDEINDSDITIKDILNISNEAKKIISNKKILNASVTGKWEGNLQNIISGDQKKYNYKFKFNIKNDGTVKMEEGNINFIKWEQNEKFINLYTEDKSKGYYIFELVGNSLVFNKIAGEKLEKGEGYTSLGKVNLKGILRKSR
ncbi:hypothetical protein HGA92_02720 [Candidatus Gracilibacteria bacterium]|nr:hypothetical protein [Candidatus Gracilibacteria bacterium]NUJ98330.1 hypothetical protein [Candidatus Gracilibacteria bacterium]NUJ99315.1 hypothetical protein [Candidatus Gracilibacteria bacterium]